MDPLTLSKRTVSHNTFVRIKPTVFRDFSESLFSGSKGGGFGLDFSRVGVTIAMFLRKLPSVTEATAEEMCSLSFLLNSFAKSLPSLLYIMNTKSNKKRLLGQ